MNPQQHHLAALRHAFALALRASVAYERAQAVARMAQLPPPEGEPIDRLQYIAANTPAWSAYWAANARCRMEFGDSEPAFLTAMAAALAPE